MDRDRAPIPLCRHLLVPDAEAASEARAHEADADFLKVLGVAFLQTSVSLSVIVMMQW